MHSRTRVDTRNPAGVFPVNGGPPQRSIGCGGPGPAPSARHTNIKEPMTTLAQPERVPGWMITRPGRSPAALQAHGRLADTRWHLAAVLVAGCSGGAHVPYRATTGACYAFGVAALERHMTVTAVPRACNRPLTAMSQRLRNWPSRHP
jgi:hypothetical protein